MVHHRFNERESNPNPHVNFITPLARQSQEETDAARDLLRALAAQVRPVMKSHGFEVNSLEEYEYNKVFAGRNWNNGETVELVLCGADGAFQRTSWLMGTLCHELAHIKHMNHGPAFQALWSRLRAEVRALQDKGYYGDGYWSSGTRLADSARVEGSGIEAGDLPEYMCGGAQTRTRPQGMRRRVTRRSRDVKPSLHTGAQTAKKREAGGRVKAAGAFAGGGQALNADLDEDDKKRGTGFRKVAGSKRAREERALAAERRLQALQNPAGDSSMIKMEPEDGDDAEGDDSDAELEQTNETDQDRLRTLRETMRDADADEQKPWRADFEDDFIFPDCDLPTKDQGGSTFTVGASSLRVNNNNIPDNSDDEGPPPSKKVKEEPPATPALAFGNLAGAEIKQRTRESLGLIGNGRKLGSGSSNTGASSSKWSASVPPGHAVSKDGDTWACLVCTLKNENQHLACMACGSTRGEKLWSDPSQ